MKILFAIKSCEGDRCNSLHQNIRDTWGKDVGDVGGELRFFVGVEASAEGADEVRLNVLDEYHSLPWKTKAISQWVMERDYDYSYLCDTDTFVIPRKLLQTDFRNYDYYGMIRRQLGVTFGYTAPDRNKKRWHIPKCFGWASGGVGYFMSRRALDIVSQRDPTIWAEDLWVGQIMGQLLIEGKISVGDARDLEGECAWHFPRNYLTSRSGPMHLQVKDWMHDMYARHNDC